MQFPGAEGRRGALSPERVIARPGKAADLGGNDPVRSPGPFRCDPGGPPAIRSSENRASGAERRRWRRGGRIVAASGRPSCQCQRDRDSGGGNPAGGHERTDIERCHRRSAGPRDPARRHDRLSVTGRGSPIAPGHPPIAFARQLSFQPISATRADLGTSVTASLMVTLSPGASCGLGEAASQL